MAKGHFICAITYVAWKTIPAVHAGGCRLPLPPCNGLSHPKVCSGPISCFSLSYKLHVDDVPTPPGCPLCTRSIADLKKVYVEALCIGWLYRPPHSCSWPLSKTPRQNIRALSHPTPPLLCVLPLLVGCCLCRTY